MFLLDYLTIKQVAFWVFVLIGSVLDICYYAWVAVDPLWDVISTSLAMAVASLFFGLMSLLAPRSKIVASRKQRDIYPIFSNLIQGDFR